MGSSSTIVSTPLLGDPSTTPPLGALKVSSTVSAPSATASLGPIGTVKVCVVAATPLPAKVKVPTAVVKSPGSDAVPGAAL